MFPASNKSVSLRELPLKIYTPEIWVSQVLDNLPVLLSDHAHLEKKAGLNALMLLHRRPEHNVPKNISKIWCDELMTIAKEEIDHLDIVLDIIHQRGYQLSKNHSNNYANDLRKQERNGNDPDDLVDRLLVSALIEARSCERFYLLGNHTEDQELCKLYCGLWSSEHNHYTTFLKLAKLIEQEDLVEKRWLELLEIESNIIQKQKKSSKMHSWIA